MAELHTPLKVYNALYVLKLDNDRYYIGITRNLNARLAEHFEGKGSKWTRKHKAISLEKVIYPADEVGLEDKITAEYIDLYGSNKIRGGWYSSSKEY